jgi:hypothetical protein
MTSTNNRIATMPKLIKPIDMLLEKWLLAYKNYDHTYEVFVNPSKKELAEISSGGNYRFIADGLKKNLYVFSVDSFHKRTWDENIRGQINDQRYMYKTPTLFGGAIDGGKVVNWGWRDGMYGDGIIEEWLTHPDMFDFTTKKYGINITKWMEDNADEMKEKVGA